MELESDVINKDSEIRGNPFYSVLNARWADSSVKCVRRRILTKVRQQRSTGIVTVSTHAI